MKVHSHLPGHKSRRHLLALSCATALASFALIARPALAEEATGEVALTSDNTLTVGTESIQTTADLVETNPTSTSEASPVASNSEQVQAETADSTEIAGTQNESKATVADTTASTDTPSETSSLRSVAAITSANPTVRPENTVTGGHYYSDSSGNWYYMDANGNKVTGQQTIDGQEVFFNYNGKQIKGAYANQSGNLIRYYDVDTGELWKNRYVEHNSNWYYLGQDGKPIRDAHTIDGQDVFFEQDGKQVKGDFPSYFNTDYYYDENTGARVTTEGFVKNRVGQDFYLDENGVKVTGLREIAGNLYFFSTKEPATGAITGVLTRDKSVSFEGDSNSPRPYGFGEAKNITRRYYFDSITGHAVKNRFVQENNSWYYYGPDGNSIRPDAGEVTIDGKIIYLNKNGRQAKGELILQNGILRYYDVDTGERVANTTMTINGMTYHFNQDGIATDAENPNGYYSDEQGNWYYKNSSGNNLVGEQIIDGKKVYFKNDGRQVKGDFIDFYIGYRRHRRFYDANSGELLTNQYIEHNGKWYYVGDDGATLLGEQTINGQEVFFNLYNSEQVKGDFARNGVFLDEYYYDKDTGEKVTKPGFVTVGSFWYYHDETGKKLLGKQIINGREYFFNQGGAYKYTTIGQLSGYNFNPLTGQTTFNGKVVNFDEFGVHDD